MPPDAASVYVLLDLPAVALLLLLLLLLLLSLFIAAFLFRLSKLSILSVLPLRSREVDAEDDAPRFGVEQLNGTRSAANAVCVDDDASALGEKERRCLGGSVINGVEHERQSMQLGSGAFEGGGLLGNAGGVGECNVEMSTDAGRRGNRPQPNPAGGMGLGMGAVEPGGPTHS